LYFYNQKKWFSLSIHKSERKMCLIRVHNESSPCFSENRMNRNQDGLDPSYLQRSLGKDFNQGVPPTDYPGLDLLPRKD